MYLGINEKKDMLQQIKLKWNVYFSGKENRLQSFCFIKKKKKRYGHKKKTFLNKENMISFFEKKKIKKT